MALIDDGCRFRAIHPASTAEHEGEDGFIRCGRLRHIKMSRCNDNALEVQLSLWISPLMRQYEWLIGYQAGIALHPTTPVAGAAGNS